MPIVPRSVRGGESWSITFLPDAYWAKHPDLTIQSCTLTDAKLLAYAKQLTKLRTSVRVEAALFTDTSSFTNQEVIDRVDAFAAKMQRGYFHRKVLRPSVVDQEEERTPIASRHRSKRKPPKPAEVVFICHEAIVEK